MSVESDCASQFDQYMNTFCIVIISKKKHVLHHNLLITPRE